MHVDEPGNDEAIANIDDPSRWLGMTDLLDLPVFHGKVTGDHLITRNDLARQGVLVLFLFSPSISILFSQACIPPSINIFSLFNAIHFVSWRSLEPKTKFPSKQSMQLQRFDKRMKVQLGHLSSRRPRTHLTLP